jgi:hypothetical protein
MLKVESDVVKNMVKTCYECMEKSQRNPFVQLTYTNKNKEEKMKAEEELKKEEEKKRTRLEGNLEI